MDLTIAYLQLVPNNNHPQLSLLLTTNQKLKISPPISHKNTQILPLTKFFSNNISPLLYNTNKSQTIIPISIKTLNLLKYITTNNQPLSNSSSTPLQIIIPPTKKLSSPEYQLKINYKITIILLNKKSSYSHLLMFFLINLLQLNPTKTPIK